MNCARLRTSVAVALMLVNGEVFTQSLGPRPTHFECAAYFGNVGVSRSEGSSYQDPRLHISGGVGCGWGPRTYFRSLVGLAQFTPSDLSAGPRGRDVYYELSWLTPILLSVGLSVHYKSAEPTGTLSVRHSFETGYVAGGMFPLLIKGGPAPVIEALYHRTTGPGPDAFYTLTVGVARF